MSIIGGATSELSILQLIASDPDGFKREIDRFEKVKRDAEEKLRVLGIAGDIEAVRSQAFAEKSRAEEALRAAAQYAAKAKEDADAIVANANVQAVSIRSRAEEDAKAIRAQAQKTLVEAEAFRSAARTVQQTLEAKVAEVDRIEDDLNAKKKALEIERVKAKGAIDRYSVRAAALEAVAKDVSEALRKVKA